MRIAIGTYSIPSEWTGTPYGHGDGIMTVELDDDGIGLVGPVMPEVNPSFLVVEAAASRLWAITEPEHGGEVVCFRTDVDGVPVQVLRRLSTSRDAPCHLTVVDGVALVSHYHGGAVAVIARDAEGLPDHVSDVIEPPSSGDGWDRAETVARPHSTLWIPGGDEFVVADCGRDTVLLYGWDRLRERAELRDVLVLPEGTGPRHLAWHAPSRSVLVSDQNSGAVTVVAYAGGGLRHVQTLTLPGLGRRRPIPSEIAVHPGGRLAVMASRWDDSLTLIEVSSDGRVRERSTVDAGGVNPRHFAFSPDGSRLVVAHQESDELALFAVEEHSLVLVGRRAVATPTCVAFWPDATDRPA